MESNPYQSPDPLSDSRLHAESAPPRDGWKGVVAAAIVAVIFWYVPFLNFPPLIILGWATSRAWSLTARAIARATSLAAGVVLGILLISGAWAQATGPNDVHRWAGHGMVTLLYLCVGFSLGVLLHQKITRHPILAVIQSLALLLCLAVSVSASLTGYLDVEPSANPVIAEENHNRFIVLHMFLLPTILLVLLGIWHFAFWSVHEASQTANKVVGAPLNGANARADAAR